MLEDPGETFQLEWKQIPQDRIYSEKWATPDYPQCLPRQTGSSTLVPGVFVGVFFLRVRG